MTPALLLESNGLYDVWAFLAFLGGPLPSVAGRPGGWVP